MPKVSVIVPVYNVEKYLRKCLDSLLKQTLDDIEVILVNDGSTDHSKDILVEYVNKFPQIFKYLEKGNGGLSDARNYGIPYATAEYIAFLDSDDYVETDLYKKMYEIAISEDSDMVECDFIWEYPEKNKIDIGVIYSGKKEMMVEARVVAWNKLIRKNLIVDNMIQFPKGLRYEDVEFFYKLLPYINKVSFLKEPLIHYVQRPLSISNVQNERTKEIFNVLDNVVDYYIENDLYNVYRDELEYTYSRISLCSSLFRIVKIKDKKIRKQLEKYTWDNLNKKFPNWKGNLVLRNKRGFKILYMKIINKLNYNIVCRILELKK